MRRLRMLVIVGIIGALVISYVGPIRGYHSRMSELRDQQQNLNSLIKQRDALRDAVSGPQTVEVIEQRARELGFMRPDEIQYRVRKIDPDPAAQRGTKGIGSWFPPVA